MYLWPYQSVHNEFLPTKVHECRFGLADVEVLNGEDRGLQGLISFIHIVYRRSAKDNLCKLEEPSKFLPRFRAFA